ncbi:MFS transporter [Methanosphaerula palustris]|uniref:Drug resistance transporter, EmrB/QacA subfamily n=1 Tax=Methanosphaerula palustris (strain ATCC BAA-1556 / DSM 19958 / E1-9c) TaxID=521011 RepID=B8GK17_METPE|nr:MFS transporter [Methanosphaerula palustris]ACL17088.1 drug resistance transporter, EmrB/QacA subfamily [Methanosphaerula palustris E1-9c]
MTTQPPSSSGTPAYTNRYIILIIVLTGILMAVIDGIVVSIALPTMTSYFGVDVAQSQWTITAYLITMTSLLLVFGKVSEYTGKVVLFIGGMAVFTVSSLACGLSTSLMMLIGFRVVQAIGAAMVFSISGAILFTAFPVTERGRAMGYLGATVAVGSIAGPVVGGFLAGTLGWEYIFFINVPIGVVLLLAAARYLRVDEQRNAHLNLDLPGSISLVVLMVALILTLGDLADGASLTTLPLALVFLLATGFFIRHERQAKNPLVELEIFQNPLFSLPMISMVLYFIANFMLGVIGPFYFEGVMGMEPTQVGLVYLVMPTIMVFLSPLTGWLYDRHHSPHYATIGMAVVAGALFVAGYASVRQDLTLILLAFAGVGIGSAFFQSPNNTDLMSALPPQKMGLASSVTATGRNLGMALGVSIATILISVFLRVFGNEDAVMGAPVSVLAAAVGIVAVISGLICLLAGFFSYLRARSALKVDHPTHPVH